MKTAASIGQNDINQVRQNKIYPTWPYYNNKNKNRQQHKNYSPNRKLTKDQNCNKNNPDRKTSKPNFGKKRLGHDSPPIHVQTEFHHLIFSMGSPFSSQEAPKIIKSWEKMEAETGASLTANYNTSTVFLKPS
eukprot:GHVP01040239.1.p1 GENE.GHVP01040239.1~~GHVP01040239.1.p1  ORF type:complete len:133 (-),score=14.37 GHVP01040239.1:300-698(-)